VKPFIESHLVKPLMDYKANPHPASADALLKAVTPIIDRGVATFGRGDANPMMRSRARRIVLDSARGYDPMRASFETHAMNNLRALQRYGAAQRRVLSVPEAVTLDAQHVREGETHLRDVLGRHPSDAELSDHLHVSRRRIAHVRGYRPGLAEGQVESAGVEGAGEDDFAPAVVQEDPSRRIAEFLYADLDPVDQLILEHRIGLNGRPRLPGNMIAAKAGISPGAVSQRLARISARMDALAGTGVVP
jgi:DNA-directed RNA polymerase specialized sigma subunit